MLHIPLASLATQFGNIDIYLLDQLLKSRISKGMKLLDAGCGGGRNIQYLMQAGVEVYGADTSGEAIAKVKNMATALAPTLSLKSFVVTDLAAMPFPDVYFDVVVCSAVLHFARSEAHFTGMAREMWRVLKPGGMLFCRFSTTIGMEGKLYQVGERLYQMPHGPVWFLADEALLRNIISDWQAEMLEPLKTVLVEQERSMTTLVLRKVK